MDGAAVFIVSNQPFLKGDVEKYTVKILLFLRIIFLDDLLAEEEISRSLVGRLGGSVWHNVSEFTIRERHERAQGSGRFVLP